MAVSYYIYYRVAQPAEAGARVRSLQSQLAAHTGVQGRLLKKRDQPELWMEIYEGVSDAAAFEAELARLVDTTGLRACLAQDGARHVECFEETCA